ncbi:MAG: emp24/gp25L/p24 family protein [Nitrososphaeria archaeon]
MCTVLFMMLLFRLVQLTLAATESFTVRGGEEATRVLKLKVDDHVIITFSVTGGDSAIHFYLACPNGTVRDFGDVGYFRYSFVCNLEGDYVLHFSNIGSSSDLIVTLNYEVEHYIFGIPQMLFLTIVIAIVCVAMVAVFILMSKPR